MQATTEQLVKTALASALNYQSTEGIASGSHLKKDLQLDSMSALMFLMKLEENMVITNEPGLYIPNIGGIRIEDILVITKKGYKNLTKLPKRFII